MYAMLPVDPFPGTFRTRFWIAPPRGRAVRRDTSVQLTSEDRIETTNNRGDMLIMPQWLSVIVTSMTTDPTSNLFLSPIPVLPSNHQVKGAATSPPEATTSCAALQNEADVALPALFSVPLYVWPDTTLREILETVLACSAAARRVLLGREEKNNNNSDDDDEVVVSDRKARRVEAGRRLVDDPVGYDAARVLHVSVGADKAPRIVPLATLALSAPRFTRSDYITLQELREARYGWKTGDLLVIMPEASKITKY